MSRKPHLLAEGARPGPDGVTDLRSLAPEDRAKMDLMIRQAMILMIGRLGGEVRIPFKEINAGTVGLRMTFKYEEATDEFVFRLDAPGAGPRS